MAAAAGKSVNIPVGAAEGAGGDGGVKGGEEKMRGLGEETGRRIFFFFRKTTYIHIGNKIQIKHNRIQIKHGKKKKTKQRIMIPTSSSRKTRAGRTPSHKAFMSRKSHRLRRDGSKQ